MDDYLRLRREATEGKKAVVIGGGLIGLKAAEGLHLLGKKVTILELADRILSAAFDRAAGRIVAKKMKANGIDVITEDTVVRIDGDGETVTGVTLKSGDSIPCDTVIVAIGVRPACRGAGIGERQVSPSPLWQLAPAAARSHVVRPVEEGQAQARPRRARARTATAPATTRD